MAEAALFASAGGGFASSAAGVGAQALINAAAASKAWDRQKNLLTRGATYQRINLLAAGINPILAAGSIGPGTARVPQASGVGLPQSAQSALAAAQTKKTSAEAETIRLGLPRARNLATFDLTPEGVMDAGRSRVNASTPQTIQAGLMRLFNSAKDALRGSDAIDKLFDGPGATEMVVPQHRKKAPPAPPNYQRPKPDW